MEAQPIREKQGKSLPANRVLKTAMKIAGARVENKRLAPGLAIFMLSGAPTAHEV
jgi:hypothetical protein